jgi:heme/copper-type cytochrome/quinol oxidase subunit 4
MTDRATVFDMLTPHESEVVVACVLAAAVIYALVKGEVFLMPYSVKRSVNARAFYVLLAIIAAFLIGDLWQLFNRPAL